MPASVHTPAHVQLVLAAANTVDVETGTDAWQAASDLARWLAQHNGGEGNPTSGRITKDHHEAAVRLRDALRTAILERTAPRFGELAKPFPLRVEFDGGTPTLVPVSTALIGGVAEILASVAESGYDGTWQRIKICPADDCRVAFFDESRNRSRTWCSMQVCGNRTKTRNFRARQAKT